MTDETPEITEEMLEELEEAEQEKVIEGEEDRLLRSQDIQEAYGYPTPDEKHNQHTFLAKAAFDSINTVKTTFLDKEEIGRPLFSVRFLLDMEDVANHYLSPIAVHLKGENRISDYFLMKVLNITDSGMSNQGFAMNLNVTRKMDTTRKKLSVESLKNLKRRKT